MLGYLSGIEIFWIDTLFPTNLLGTAGWFNLHQKRYKVFSNGYKNLYIN